jgi:hypothetical protein
MKIDKLNETIVKMQEEHERTDKFVGNKTKGSEKGM